MSRILAYTAPSHGQLFPMVPILEELRRRGHSVAVRTLASEVELMRSLGLDAAPIAAEIEALAMDDWKARTPPGALLRAGRMFRARAEHDAHDLERAIEAQRPDALLVDIATWGALSAAEAWGGPWAATCPFPLSLRSQTAPATGPGSHPLRGAIGWLRDRPLQAALTAGFDRLALPTLNPLRRQRELRPFDHGEEIFLAPPLILYMTAEPFQPHRRDWPASVVMVGPCAWEPPGDLPTDLTGVSDPLVLVTNSTEFQNDGRLIEAAFEALADEPCHVVATMPATGGADPRVPSNATLLRFAPHGPILDRCACAITHGGMGATQKALVRGVPVCAVPFGRDQYEVARRVEAAGAGTRLPSYLLRPKRLRERVREAVEYREGARRLGLILAAAGGPSAAADAFERRLS